MPRIKTDQPSANKPVLLFIPTASNGGFVPTTWGTIAEAPDFSIPTLGDVGVVLDPADASRELRAGSLFFETPLAVTNTTSAARWVEVQMLLQGVSGQAIPVAPQIIVPALETLYLPIQGLRLLKTDLASTGPGGRLQVRAEVGDALTILAAAAESEAEDHAPDTEAP